MTVHGPERRGPERPGPDYPAEWDREPEEPYDMPCPISDGDSPCVLPAGHSSGCLR